MQTEKEILEPPPVTLEELMPLVEEALEYGGDTHTVDDLVYRLQTGASQLWLEGKSMVVTEIHPYPRYKVLHFWLAAGNLEDILKMGPRIYAFGRAHGCKAATIMGRKGWQKAIAEQGWKPRLVEYIKEL